MNFEDRLIKVIVEMVTDEYDHLLQAKWLAEALLDASSWEVKLSEEALDFLDELVIAIDEEMHRFLYGLSKCFD